MSELALLLVCKGRRDDCEHFNGRQALFRLVQHSVLDGALSMYRNLNYRLVAIVVYEYAEPNPNPRIHVPLRELYRWTV